MIIIDHGHKNKCEFQHIAVSEPFRSLPTKSLYIKTIAVRLECGSMINCVKLSTGEPAYGNPEEQVFTVKAHIEVD